MTRRNSILTFTFAAAIAAFTVETSAQPATSEASATVPPAIAAENISPLERARADAVTRLYASISSTSVGDVSLGAVIDRLGVKSRVLDRFAEAEQVGGPRTIGEGLVQVTLELSGDRAAKIVIDAINENAGPSPVALDRIAEALRAWTGRAFRTTGDSRTVDTRSGDGRLPKNARAAKMNGEPVSIHLPDTAPDWIRQAQTATGVATSTGDSLKTARIAEKAAREALREQLSKLTVDASQTLGDASVKTIDVAVIGAKIAGVDYRADGSVQVSVSVDGQQLWQLLQFAADQ